MSEMPPRLGAVDLEDLVENVNDLIQSVGPDGSFLYVNRAWCRTLGYSREEAARLSVFDVIHPSSRSHCQEVLQRVLTGEPVVNVEATFVAKDGRAVIVEVSVNCRFQDGRPVATRTILRDITERKRTEEALRESAQRYCSLVELAPDAILLLEDDRICYCNPAGVELLGARSIEELLGRPFGPFFHPEEQELAAARRRTIRAAGDAIPPHTFRVRRLDDLQVDVESQASFCLHQGKPALQVVLRNITERKRAEEALRRSEARLVEAQRVGRVGSWELDLVSNQATWSEEGYRLLGLESRKLPADQDTFINCVHADDRAACREALAQSIRSGLALDHEFRVVWRDGQVRWLHSRGRVSHDAAGRPVRFVGISLDVTDRKRAEEALRDSQHMLRMILDNIPQGVFWKDHQSRYLGCNRVVARAFGFETPEDIIGKDDHQIAGPTREQADFFVFKDRQVMSSDVPELGIIEPATLADGRCVWLETNKIPMYDAAGRVVGVLGTWQDITARKRAEEALQQSEANFRGYFENVAVGAAQIDTEGRFVRVNDRYCEITGYSRAELLAGMSPLDLDHPDDLAVDRNGLQQFARNEISVYTAEKRYVRKGGQVVWVHVSASHVRDASGRPLYSAGIIKEITDRKRAEEALRQSEERFRSVVHDQTELICRFAPDCRLLFVNDAYAACFGRTVADLIGRSFLEFVPEGERAAVQQFFAGFAPDQPVRTQEHVVTDRHGQTRWHQWTNRAFFDAGGRPVEFQGVARDVTDRKRAEEALHQERARHRHLFEHTPIAIWEEDFTDLAAWLEQLRHRGVTDLRAYLSARPDEVRHALGLIRVTDVNQTALTQNAARTKEELLQKLPTLFGDAALTAFLDELEGVWHGKTSIEYESSGRRLDGRQLDLIIRIEIACRDGRPDWSRVIVTGTDITERKHAEDERRHLEAQIRHAQKLESLGVLAGGIAHDFNNLLTSVLGNANLALMQLPDESPARALLREIEKGAQSAADLTQQMLAYSGRGPFVIKALRLDTLVREMTQLLGTVVSKKAALNLNLERCTIEGDAAQVRQVVMNLITNASDALNGEVGTIGVRTGVVQADAARLRSPFLAGELPAGPYALVEVEDTGCGMSQETRAKIFDPFFTTKFTGRGLGLAAVLGIVKSHRGTIQVNSTPGRGTVFQVLFPCCSGTPEEEPAARPEGPPKRGHGTILVVEDVPIIRLFARRALESVGFQVREAADGREGLDLWQQHRAEIVAVLLDLTMPRMDGKEALRELRAHDPAVPVLLMSGYSDSDVSAHFKGAGVNGFIQKPFQASELIARVCQLLPPTETTGRQ